MPDRPVGASLAVAVLMFLAAPPPGAAQEQSPSACRGQDPWVSGLAGRALAYGEMGRFAVAWQGDPVSCEGQVESEFDGASFGSVEVRFSNGMVFAVQTFPPEGSVTRLAMASGFDDPDAVVAVVREHAERFGLRLDWSSPDVTEDAGKRVTTYWDPDPGLNASAAFVHEGERLVEVRISAAL